MQLRTENAHGTCYNMVGFQTKLTYPEQRRVFRLIPGLENAEFLRLGSLHRNTFINSPQLLRETLQLKSRGTVFFAGQLVGVEGYTESAAMGGIAGINAARGLADQPLVTPPPNSAHGRSAARDSKRQPWGNRAGKGSTRPPRSRTRHRPSVAGGSTKTSVGASG